MKKELVFVLTIFTLMECGCKNNNPKPTKTPILPPTQAELIAPAQSAVCTSGTILSATESSILFTWNASNYTDSYNLIIKNLLTSDSTVQNTVKTQLATTLLRNTPYSWHIVSKSNKTSATAQSVAWKFYNSGPGIVTYVPFPAEITSPIFDQIVSTASGTVNLNWVGSVIVPDAITNYDVYLGTNNSPPIVAPAISNSFLNNVPVTSKTTYYWRVITRDVNGNTSDSGLFQFSVK